MATNESLRADVNGLLTEAKRITQIAVAGKIGEATVQYALGSSRVAFSVLGAVEEEGAKFIAGMMPPYRGATSTKANPAAAKVTLRGGLDAYLEESRAWGRSSPAFADSRNNLLDRDHGPMCERLRDKLELEMRLVDAEPRKPIWERYPVPVGIAAFSALVGLGGLVVAILRHA